MNGGRIYQNTSVNVVNSKGQQIEPPWRVMPGRLSVSRSFGDAMAKLPQYGGTPGVIIAVPEIHAFPINANIDWLLIGCDGIFDQLSNEQIADTVWAETRKQVRIHSVSSGLPELAEKCCGAAVNAVIRQAMETESTDNLSVVLLFFKNFLQNAEE